MQINKKASAVALAAVLLVTGLGCKGCSHDEEIKGYAEEIEANYEVEELLEFLAKSNSEYAKNLSLVLSKMGYEDLEDFINKYNGRGKERKIIRNAADIATQVTYGGSCDYSEIFDADSIKVIKDNFKFCLYDLDGNASTHWNNFSSYDVYDVKDLDFSFWDIITDPASYLSEKYDYIGEIGTFPKYWFDEGKGMKKYDSSEAGIIEAMVEISKRTKKPGDIKDGQTNPYGDNELVIPTYDDNLLNPAFGPLIENGLYAAINDGTLKTTLIDALDIIKAEYKNISDIDPSANIQVYGDSKEGVIEVYVDGNLHEVLPYRPTQKYQNSNEARTDFIEAFKKIYQLIGMMMPEDYYQLGKTAAAMEECYGEVCGYVANGSIKKPTNANTK